MALRIAARWVEERRVRPGNVGIVVSVQDAIDRSPVLRELASRYAWASLRTLQDLPARSVILAVWPSRKMLERVVELRPSAVCVLEWRVDQSRDWLGAHGARDLSGRAPALATGDVADPVTRVALEELALFANPVNALVQTDDRDHAILTLRELIAHHHAIRPDELYRWAIARGWDGHMATNLRKLAEEMLAGRRHRVTRPPFGEGVYRAWQRKAAETSR
jgi:hypothetical protein